MQVIVYSLLLMSASECEKPTAPVPEFLNLRCPDGTIIASRPGNKCLELRRSVIQSADKSRRAMPKNDKTRWVTMNDYPTSPVRTEREGTTYYRLTVAANGRVFSCQVTQSSGYSSLDKAACRAVRRRARFNPALDKKGNPAIGTWNGSFKWETPK